MMFAIFSLICSLALPATPEVERELVSMPFVMLDAMHETEEIYNNSGLQGLLTKLDNKPKQRRIAQLFGQLLGEKRAVEHLGPASVPRNRVSYIYPPFDKMGHSRATFHLTKEKGPMDYNLSFSMQKRGSVEVVVAWRNKKDRQKVKTTLINLYGQDNRAAFFGPCTDFDSYVLGIFDEDGNTLEILPRTGVLTPANAGQFNPADTWQCADSYFLHDKQALPQRANLKGTKPVITKNGAGAKKTGTSSYSRLKSHQGVKRR